MFFILMLNVEMSHWTFILFIYIYIYKKLKKKERIKVLKYTVVMVAERHINQYIHLSWFIKIFGTTTNGAVKSSRNC